MSSDSKQNRRAAKETQKDFETPGPMMPTGTQPAPEMRHDKRTSAAGKKRKRNVLPQEINVQALSDSIEQDARRYAQRFPS